MMFNRCIDGQLSTGNAEAAPNSGGGGGGGGGAANTSTNPSHPRKTSKILEN